MKIKRRASITWNGGFQDGKGSITTATKALDAYPYGYASRFGDQAGTNPEELLGAAHAACFTMALSMILGQSNFVADSLDTNAEVTLEQVEDGFAITAVHLTLKAKIPGIDQQTFEGLAAAAKAGCPVSKVLRADISLDATLVG